MHGVGIEVWPAQKVEVFEESGVRWGADEQALGACHALVTACADALSAAQRTHEPGSIALAHQLAGELHPKVNSAFETKRDKSMQGARQAGWRGIAVFDCGQRRILELGHFARFSLCHSQTSVVRGATESVSAASTGFFGRR